LFSADVVAPGGSGSLPALAGWIGRLVSGNAVMRLLLMAN
jgi:hypothetical protein